MNGSLKKGSKGEFVQQMQEMLKKLGYNISTDGAFGPGTEKAVLEFQKKNNLKADGIVGSITWTMMQDQSSKATDAPKPAATVPLFLTEQDFSTFAAKYQLEVPAIKAVHEVESSGHGFLNGKIKILFEGHVFWRELVKRGIDPNKIIAGNEDVLHKNYIPQNPRYKLDQHTRLDKAVKINAEAAFCAASYGLFQVMGYHYSSMNFPTAKAFADYLSVNESNQLDIFGKFLEANNLLKPLRERNWARFALGYNGQGYQSNKYDTKLAAAYAKYKKM